MPDEITWLSFDDGCAGQAAGLKQAAEKVQAWLDGGAAKQLSGASLLLAGIGASYAAAATPLFVMREAGVVAYRTDCGDLPAGGTRLADYYIGISQSGRSRETLQTVLEVPEDRRVAVVNRASGPLSANSGAVMHLGDLADSRMSSLGFTATVLGLGMLADWLKDGKADARWHQLGELSAETVDRSDSALAGFAEHIAGAGMVDVVARGASLTAAEQGALLFREGPLVPSMGMDTRSYLHGPMDCAGPTSHVLIGRQREGLLAEQLAEKDVPILLVTDADVDAPASIVRIPELPHAQRVIVEVALLQRLVSHVGRVLGRDVDASVFRRLDTKVDSTDDLARTAA